MTLLKTIAAATLALSAQLTCASPIVLDVNSAPATYGFGTVTEDGFRITGAGSYYLSLGGSRYCGPACPDNGSNNLLAQGGSFTVAAVSGAAFSLTSFEGGEAHMGLTNYWARHIRVSGSKVGGGQAVADFALDFINDGPGAAVDFQRFMASADFGNLTSLTFSGVGGSMNWFTLDNITLDAAFTAPLPAQASQTPQASAVPEPGSLLLTALALAGLAGTRRRTSRG